MLVRCLFCDKEFEKKDWNIKRSPRHFCSKHCAITLNNRGNQHHKPKDRFCRRCNAIYRNEKGYSSTLCFDCRENDFYTHDIKQVTLGVYWSKLSVKDKHPSWKNAHIRHWARKWNLDRIAGGCQKCGYSLHVELCHIKPLSSFSENDTLWDANNPANILVLCPNHHWEFDNGLLAIDDIQLS